MVLALSWAAPKILMVIVPLVLLASLVGGWVHGRCQPCLLHFKYYFIVYLKDNFVFWNVNTIFTPKIIVNNSFKSDIQSIFNTPIVETDNCKNKCLRDVMYNMAIANTSIWFLSFFLTCIRLWMLTYCHSHFTVYISRIVIWYTLNLYSAIC